MSALKMRQRSQRGFTLIELLVVVAIIGIISALIIPNMLDSMRKAKQKRTMSDIHFVGTAWLSWLTDQVSASAAGQQQTAMFDWSVLDNFDIEDLTELLVPEYASIVPRKDGWGFPYEFGFSGIQSVLPMGARSSGVDGEFSATTYERGAFRSTDYDEDIVWAGGYFIHWPAGLAAAAGDS